jgi:tetratricopeptide (TPR) repeat protein
MSETIEAGGKTVLLCVGIQMDLVHARLPSGAELQAEDLSKHDRVAIPRGRSFVVRTGISPDIPVPGEWFEVDVKRRWRFGATDYLSGTVLRCWLDLPAVGLPPLAVTYEGEWTIDDWLESRGLELSDLESDYSELAEGGPRREVEMEQVLPDSFTRLELEEDPILEASEWRQVGDSERCEKLLNELLRQDLRCVDAHSHLGNLHLEGYWGWSDAERAMRHYRAGVEIAEVPLSPDGRDVTPRGFTDNRPYLRALHGLGLAHWAQGDFTAAGRCFAKLLVRDPDDGAGARFLLPAVRDGVDYESYKE